MVIGMNESQYNAVVVTITSSELSVVRGVIGVTIGY